ncbi:unnamed protein product [Gongylonema pulchrum]|uniref:HD_domain domain-containing protein n=1 Tax=Gongylonema pulchrum TaxID=637853 RepID=A0A183CZW5_9BILA|nr:unnamed protein product [Gongylonema pulchrum]
MQIITEEAANIWPEPSAKIAELIEQFKDETAYYARTMSLWYKDSNVFDSKKFQSEQISKLATIYSKMHPESVYSHVHTHFYHLSEHYFGVHT